MKIAIVDYGMGNLASVENAFNYIGINAIESTSDISIIQNSDCIILPGVGAFKDAMKNLRDLNLIETLNEEILHKKKPLLAICLGMQLLLDYSEEGGYCEGLKWIPGRVVKLDVGLPVPHMGWNEIEFKHDSPLFNGIEADKNFYFVHSYHAICDSKNVIATTQYGVKINVGLKKENIIGFQFHPEKSQHNGLKLLSNFIAYIEQGCYVEN